MSDEVSQFLEQVEKLRGQQIEDDQIRAREREEFLAAKRERQARREGKKCSNDLVNVLQLVVSLPSCHRGARKVVSGLVWQLSVTWQLSSTAKAIFPKNQTSYGSIANFACTVYRTSKIYLASEVFSSQYSIATCRCAKHQPL